MTAPRLGTYPELAPDELLYSYLARLVLLNALRDPGRVMRWLFDNEDAIASIDLPIRLETFQRNLGPFSPLSTAEQWIDHATLLPYYEAFRPAPVRTSVRENMLSDAGSMVKWRMGVVAHGFGATVTLRYCPECVLEDGRTPHGPYWHRVHHLPGVTVCVQHGVGLVAGLTPSRMGNKQQFLLPPTRINSAGRRARPHPSLVRFARLANELLMRSPGQDAVGGTVQTYREALLAAGYGRSDRFIDFDRLAADLRRHQNGFEGFVHRDRLLSSPRTPLAWLRTLVGRLSRSSHPICHLLLIDFLFGSVDAFRSALAQRSIERVDRPSEAPQPVPSEAADDASLALLTDASQSCRDVAALLGKSVNTVVTRRRVLGVAISERRKTLSAERRSAIEEQLRRGIGAKQVARDVQVSLSSVYRVRALLPADALTAVAPRMTQRARCAWSRALRRKPQGVKWARHDEPALYAWLYRNDRDWLLATNAQSRQQPHSRRPRVNWPRRDAHLCAQVIRVARSLRREAPCKRISTSLLARAVGEQLVRQHAASLPKTMAAIRQHTQSKAVFRESRLAHAARRLIDEGKTPRAWRILKVAGLRKDSSK